MADKAEKQLKEGKKVNPEVLQHYHTLVQLRNISNFIYPEARGRAGFVSKLKCLPIFMYGFMLIRAKENYHYRPDDGHSHTPPPPPAPPEEEKSPSTNSIALVASRVPRPGMLIIIYFNFFILIY